MVVGMSKVVSKLSVESYEHQLEHVHHFFPRIDAKVPALFSVASGQIAVAAINLSANDLRRDGLGCALQLSAC